MAAGGGNASGGGRKRKSWTCGACDYHNFGFRDACHNCGKKRPQHIGGDKGDPDKRPRARKADGGNAGAGAGSKGGGRADAKDQMLKELREEIKQLKATAAGKAAEEEPTDSAAKQRAAENEELDTLRRQMEFCKLQGPSWSDKLQETQAKLESKIASRRAGQPLSLRLRNLEEKEDRAKKASEKAAEREKELREQLEACVADRASKDEALKQIQEQKEELRHEKAQGAEAEATAAAEVDVSKGLPLWKKIKASFGDALPEGATDLEAWIAGASRAKPAATAGPPAERQRLCQDPALAEFLGEWGFEGERIKSFSAALADKLGKAGASFAPY